MKIQPININRKPYFASRSRMDQDNAIKNYKVNPFRGPINNEPIFVDKPLFIQQRSYSATERGIKPTDKTYDSFTGLRDKNYLLAYLNVAIQEAYMENKQLSIAMFDMDNFKSINELLGYETGDVFIKEISKCLSKIAKDNDIDIYRFGGEEFIIVFSDQTDAEKSKIAGDMTKGVRTNSKIQSYKPLYTKNAQSRLEKSAYSTAKIQKISELQTKKETIKEVIANLATKEAKQDPYFEVAQGLLSLKIKDSYLALIAECLRKEKNENTIAFLNTVKSKLTTNNELLETEQDALDEYLYSIYDKASEIYQTKKWISDYTQNGGFGITCGVINIEPESLENKSPMDVIDMAGRVLKKGKNTRKAQVYIETIHI